MLRHVSADVPRAASMRPEDFSPGNSAASSHPLPGAPGFNEAGGFLPRKPGVCHIPTNPNALASMRPEDFSPGNAAGLSSVRASCTLRFNEAGGFLPRKPAAHDQPLLRRQRQLQ